MVVRAGVHRLANKQVGASLHQRIAVGKTVVAGVVHIGGIAVQQGDHLVEDVGVYIPVHGPAIAQVDGGGADILDLDVDVVEAVADRGPVSVGDAHQRAGARYYLDYRGGPAVGGGETLHHKIANAKVSSRLAIGATGDIGHPPAFAIAAGGEHVLVARREGQADAAVDQVALVVDAELDLAVGEDGTSGAGEREQGE